MLNKAMLIGNLGKDPELKHTQNGNAVCNFSIATTEKWKGQDGCMQESTEWHNIIVWGKQAESCAAYLQKGKRVYIEGKITKRSWDDKQSGQKKETTEIVAKEIKFLSPATQGQQQGQQQQPNQQYQQQPNNQQYQQRNTAPATAPQGHVPAGNLDDIPF